MDEMSPLDTAALQELTKDLQQLKVELLMDCGGVEHADEVELTLIDSIDNILDAAKEHQDLQASTTDEVKLRRSLLKIEALLLFLNEAMDFSDEDSEDLEFDEKS